MPNFANTRYGVITRLATLPVPRALAAARLYGADVAGVYVDALAVRFDTAHGMTSSSGFGQEIRRPLFRTVIAFSTGPIFRSTRRWVARRCVNAERRDAEALLDLSSLARGASTQVFAGETS